MKKQLLFVTQYLHTGGIEKSLLTLLSDLNYEQYDVDLLLFDYSGLLLKEVPREVNILPPLFETFSTPLIKAVPTLIRSKNYRLLIGKLLAGVLSKLAPGVGTGIRWKVYRRILECQRKRYDVAISYIDFFCNYYVTEMVSATKKVVYNHLDYAYSKEKGWPSPSLDRKCFAASDHIVSVAESSKKTLEKFFPECSQKIRVIHNRVSKKTVQEMAKQSNDTHLMKDPHKIKIVTVARLVDEKGVFWALEACQILVKQNYPIIWYLIGKGPLLDELSFKAVELGIEHHFVLLGEKENPYPFMAMADIYVQPSKTEAHCVAVEEAIALFRPIVVTNIPSFQSQIQNNKTGIIAEGSSRGIAEGVRRLIDSKELRWEFTENLQRNSERNQEELNKFYQILSI
ncbi:glycosyltransferase [Heyndrickxia acidicola]|uniref:Glycosyltransferase n=1 Tax=Heyndrickxia acidicola TaxID=209389 RepID=A0ABU6MKI9_9BACI|nr:glycosyltransferase [Heyndrickxia acidicola]MED1205197.1 glycosyltransferase [Heyndrickxia acidicola]